MKDIFDEESKKALAAYRMQRAHETLREADVMIREAFLQCSYQSIVLCQLLCSSGFAYKK